MKKKETFADIFAKKRDKKEMTYRDLSKQTGLTHSTFVKYEKGLGYPKESTLRQLCSILDMDYNKTSELISKEKEKYIYKKAQHPDLRKIFLDAYMSEYASSKKNLLSKKEMSSFLSIFPLHPIEETLIEETNKRLRKKGVFHDNADITSSDLSTERKRSFFKRVISEWGFLRTKRQLLITFEDKIGETNTVSYKFTIGVTLEKSIES